MTRTAAATLFLFAVLATPAHAAEDVVADRARAVEDAERSFGERDPRTIEHLDRLAFEHKRSGDIEAAVRVTELALERTADVGTERATDRWNRFLRLADMLYSVGRYRESEATLRSAIAYRTESHGRDDLEVARGLGRLAGTIRRTRPDDPEVTTDLLEAIEIARTVTGEDSRETAMRLSSLATHYRLIGRGTDATDTALRSLAIRERLDGEHHPGLFHDRARIAGEMERAGRIDDAIALYAAAVRTREANGAPDHPDLVLPLMALTRLSTVRGDLDAAVEHADRALAIAETAWGADHPRTAGAENFRAAVARTVEGAPSPWRAEPRVPAAQGVHPEPAGAVALQRRAQEAARDERYEDAEAMLLQAVEMHREESGEPSRAVADAMALVAWVFDLQGRDDEAIEWHVRSSEVLHQALGDADPRVALRYYTVARVLSGPRPTEALETYARAIDVWHAIGEPNPDMARALEALARVQARLGLDEEAQATLMRTAEVWAALAGPRASEAARNRLSLAQSRLEDDRHAEAESILEGVRADLERVDAPDPGLQVRTLRLLATTYHATERSDLAAGALLEALAIDESRRGDTPEGLAVVHRIYASLFRGIGRPDLAAGIAPRSVDAPAGFR